uniref:Interleukin 7 receptor n=1 Tax=Pelusios castaneus TaxID=367368 RepID=A0A8C8VQF5_9SAUR
MIWTSTAFGILLLFLLHATSGESGFSSADGDGTAADDELDNVDIECSSQLEIKEYSHSLTCNVMDLNFNYTNINLTLCTANGDRICSTMEKQDGTYFLYFYEILAPKDVCVVLDSQRKYCRNVIVTNIVKPETPFDVNITFQKDANEYLIQYRTPHSKKKYLKDKLIHEIAYGQENGTWRTIQSQYLQIKLLGKSLQMGASYEVKVRSKPNGKFFKGTWSEWSSSEYFQTAVEHLRKKSNDMFVAVISTVVFLLFVIVLVLILTFWKTRIKPLLWPKLPDYKKNLEQLCKNPKKNFDTSFNPESFGYVHIHKVDSIQAKAEMECFLQPSAPLEADVSEKDRNESDMKKSLTVEDKSILKLPVAYGGIWPTDTMSGHLSETHPSMLDGFNNVVPYEECSSNGTQLYNYGLMTQSSSSVDPTVQLRSGPLNPVSQIQLNNGIQSSNKDEAYVTMSSFCKHQ